MTHTSLVAFDSVGLSASRTTILRDVTFELSPGDVMGVIGPNGSGKTTLIRLLSTLAKPTTGTWRILEATSGGDRADLARARHGIAMVGHSASLWPELTLQENFDVIAELSPVTDHGDALAAVGLSGAAHRPAGLASMGMQRRLEFARILARLPRLLLLDEAHGGLDTDAATIVDETIQRVQRRGGAAILVSHHATQLDGVVNRMARLDRGRLVEDDT